MIKAFNWVFQLLNILKKKHTLLFLTHILIMGATVFALICLFFFVYLPNATLYNQSIQIPDLQNRSITEAKVLLEERELQYVIRDSVFTDSVSHNHIITQDPSAGAFAKKGRKVYLTVNSAPAPTTYIPPILFGSVKNALSQLSIVKISVRNIYYKNDIAKNAVLGVIYKRKQIPNDSLQIGYLIPKGEAIDLLVGTGKYPDNMVSVANVIKYPLKRVRNKLISEGFQLNILKVSDTKYPKGTILSQSLKPFIRVPVGSTLTLGVVH